VKPVNRQQGFTLIEILVVVVIIGVLLTATVALRGDHSGQRALIAEGERLRSVFITAQQEAIRWGLPVKLTVKAGSYGFEVFKPEYGDDPATIDEGAVPATGLVLAALKRQPDGSWSEPQLRSLAEYQPERGMRFRLQVANKAASELMIQPSGLTRSFSMSLSFPETADRVLIFSGDGASLPDYQLQ